MTGIYLSIPNSNFSASPSKLGTAALLEDDVFAVLSLPGLKNWWQPEDASIASGVMTLPDRKGGASFVSNLGSGSTAPAIITEGGQKGLQFNGAGLNTGGNLLEAPVALASFPAASTRLYLITPTDLTIPYAVFGYGRGDSDGMNDFLWGGGVSGFVNGSFRSQIKSGNQVGSSIALAAVDTLSVIGVSFDGTKIGFSRNGVFDRYQTPAIVGNFPATTSVRLGTTGAGNNRFGGKLFGIMQFDRDMHAQDNLPYLGWVTRRMMTRYGIV